MATSTQVKCVAGIGGISQNGSATISRHIALVSTALPLPTLNKCKTAKIFCNKNLGNKASCPLLPHRPLHIIEVPWLPLRDEEADPFCSLKFSVLQMTSFYKPISEEVDSFQGQGENTGSNTRRLCFALSFNCATKLPQSFPARAESY